MSMIIVPGVRPTWLVLIMEFIQPQCTSGDYSPEITKKRCPQSQSFQQ